MTLKRPIFITLEGGEGVGKSTLMRKLSQSFAALERKVMLTREPGGTVLADRIRQVFTDPPKDERLTVESELMLVSAARAQHVSQKISPFLNDGGIVICDRFYDSTRVYQGFLGGMSEDFLECVIEKTVFGCCPDITFLLDCDPQMSIPRLKKRALENQENLSRYDSAELETHIKLRQGFLHYAKKFKHRFEVLDASKPAEQVYAEAKIALNTRFGFEL